MRCGQGSDDEKYRGPANFPVISQDHHLRARCPVGCQLDGTRPTIAGRSQLPHSPAECYRSRYPSPHLGNVGFKGEITMSRVHLAGMAAVCVTAALMGTAQAQQPPTATTKVDGTDNVYIFRYMGHQSMFIVTPDGVIATDPISERRPAKPYIDAIQAVSKAPIKYVIYSHSHFDHIAGGKPFKDMGATFIAHKNAKARIEALKPADVVMPDEVVDDLKLITLGGTTLELSYVGRNLSDS